MSAWKAKPLERTTLLPRHVSGLDSVQGYLEMALWYDQAHVRFSCDPADREVFHSMYFHLCQLEKEGHLLAEWRARADEHKNLLELKQLALTTSGHKLLAELRAKSRWGKLKEKLTSIGWAVASSVATTLAVLALKGN